MKRFRILVALFVVVVFFSGLVFAVTEKGGEVPAKTDGW